MIDAGGCLMIDDPSRGGSDPGAWATAIAHTPHLAAQVATKSRANAGAEAGAALEAETPVEPVSRPAGGRTPAATPEPMDVTAGETAPDIENTRVPPQATDSARAGEAALPPIAAASPKYCLPVFPGDNAALQRAAAWCWLGAHFAGRRQ